MNDSIGGRINELIGVLNIKKVRFAEQIKVDQSYVTQLIKGRNAPSERVIDNICRAFNVRVEWLRDGDGEMFIEKKPEPLETLLSGLLGRDNVTDEDRTLIKNFLELSDNSRKAVIEFVQKCAKELAAPPPPPDTDIAAKLAELERQNKEIMEQNKALAAEIAAIREEDAEQEQAEPVSASVTPSQFR